MSELTCAKLYELYGDPRAVAVLSEKELRKAQKAVSEKSYRPGEDTTGDLTFDDPRLRASVAVLNGASR